MQLGVLPHANVPLDIKGGSYTKDLGDTSSVPETPFSEQ